MFSLWGNVSEKSFLRIIFRKSMVSLTEHYTFYRLIFLGFSDFLITFSSIIVAIFIYTRIIYIPYTWPIIFSIIFVTFFIKFLSFSTFQIYNISFQHASILYVLKTSSVIFISAVINFFLLKTIFATYWIFTIAVLYVLFDITGSVGFRFLPLIYHEVYNKADYLWYIEQSEK